MAGDQNAMRPSIRRINAAGKSAWLSLMRRISMRSHPFLQRRLRPLCQFCKHGVGRICGRDSRRRDKVLRLAAGAVLLVDQNACPWQQSRCRSGRSTARGVSSAPAHDFWHRRPDAQSMASITMLMAQQSAIESANGRPRHRESPQNSKHQGLSMCTISTLLRGVSRR
jgi:hypothetical protein